MLLVALALAGCSVLPSPSADPFAVPENPYDILVRNGTTLDVGIRVNGTIARIFRAGETGTISAGTLEPLPWVVDAVTASGRILDTFAVAAGSVGCTYPPDGGRDCTGAGARVELSCGRLDVAVTVELPAGPPPGPGEPGDCVP